LDFLLPASSDTVTDSTIGKFDLSGLQAEILLGGTFTFPLRVYGCKIILRTCDTYISLSVHGWLSVLYRVTELYTILTKDLSAQRARSNVSVCTVFGYICACISPSSRITASFVSGSIRRNSLSTFISDDTYRSQLRVSRVILVSAVGEFSDLFTKYIPSRVTEMSRCTAFDSVAIGRM